MVRITIREVIKKIPYAKTLGQSLRRKKNRIVNKVYPKLARVLHHRALIKVRAKKTPLNVVFMVIHESTWKFDRLYWEMEKSADFNPIILICPYTLQNKEIMLRDMEKAYSWYKKRDYQVISSLNNKEWVDVKSQLKPDLMVFTNPHDLTRKQYLAKSFINYLSIYTPYGFPVSKYLNYSAQYNQVSHNTMWKIFTTNQMDKDIFVKYSNMKGKNVEVSGYPGADDLIDKNYKAKQVWKAQKVKKKKIIWAPHHSFEKESPIGWSTFLVFANFLKNMSTKYSQQVQFSFRPHPLLKDKLYEHPNWGVEKTNDFYDYWENSENTQSDMVSYTDLFLTSDAIIHDSGSFLAEYLYVNKPSMYLIADERLEERFSPFGVAALHAYSHGKVEREIEHFIQHDVINEDDSMMDKRNDFRKRHLLHDDSQVPSEFIFKYLKESFCL